MEEQTHRLGPMRLLLMNSGGTWVIQCLEYNIAAQGGSLEEVEKSFRAAFVSQALVNLHHGKKPMEDVPAAHPRYFRKYQQALELTRKVDVFAAPDGPDHLTPAWMIDAIATEMRLSG